jgi:hypothetical protein
MAGFSILLSICFFRFVGAVFKEAGVFRVLRVQFSRAELATRGTF